MASRSADALTPAEFRARSLQQLRRVIETDGPLPLSELTHRLGEPAGQVRRLIGDLRRSGTAIAYGAGGYTVIMGGDQ